MKIGVFDSGVGGMSMAQAIIRAFPGHQVILREDKDNLPYGTKTSEQLLDLVEPILKDMEQDGCDVIVIACNTVSTTIAKQLREKLSIPLVTVEPMIKPASKLTKSGTIAVCATPTTLASDRYQKLKSEYADGITVLEPDCSRWAIMIEDKEIDEREIAETISGVLAKGADVVVLACTHYHWIEEDIDRLTADKAVVLQPEQPVLDELRRVLARLT